MNIVSPFDHLLHSNNVPSDQEIPQVKRFLAAHKAAVSDLDREIQQLEDAMKLLRQRRSEHLAVIHDHDALLSPVKRMPTDIMSTIFLLTTAGSGASPLRDPNPPPPHAPVVLSHVCQHWRKIALQTPLLWTRLHVKTTTFHPALQSNAGEAPSLSTQHWEEWESRIRKAKEMAETWLARSAQCPLIVSFHGHDVFDWSISEYSDEDRARIQATVDQENSWIVDLLCRESYRWRELIAGLSLASPTSPLIRLLQLPPEETPLLQSFSPMIYVKSLRTWLEGHTAPPLPLMRYVGIPSIRSLAISGTYTIPLFTLPIQWPRLTEFTFDAGFNGGGNSQVFGPREALELLKLCPNLVRCSLPLNRTVSQEPDSPITSSERIHLPRLQHLELNNGPIPLGFSKALNLPCLHSFVLRLGFGYNMGPTHRHNDGVIEMLEIFGSQLSIMMLDASLLSSSSLARCLELVPNVEQLALATHRLNSRGNTPGSREEYKAVFTPDILQLLTPDAQAEDGTITSCYCPRLRRFRFKPDSERVEANDVVRFIAARQKPLDRNSSLERLRSVEVRFLKHQEVDAEEELKKMGVEMDTFNLVIDQPPKPVPRPPASSNTLAWLFAPFD